MSKTFCQEQTRALLQRAQQGDHEAREMLIRANMPLARSIAQRFRGRKDPEDLFQVACLGLMKAIDHFDLSFSVRFSTYAVPRIMGELRRYLQQDQPVKVARILQEKAGALQQAKDHLTQQWQRAPTIGELAAWLDWEKEDVVMAWEVAVRPTSLQEVIFQDEGEPILLADQVPGEAPPFSTVDNLALQQALATLDIQERQLVRMRFFDSMKQTEVAARLHLSQPQVSRLEQRVLGKLRLLLDE